MQTSSSICIGLIWRRAKYFSSNQQKYFLIYAELRGLEVAQIVERMKLVAAEVRPMAVEGLEGFEEWTLVQKHSRTVKYIHRD